MKRIIAGIDFSPASRNAAHYAADLAVQVNAELLLMNVVEIPISVSEIPPSGGAIDELIDDSERDLIELKNEVSLYVHDKIPIYPVVRIGTVIYSLQQEASKGEVFCIVMGTDSLTPAEHLLVKDHALAAIRSTSVPVIIVPNGFSFTQIKKIVLAADLKGIEKIRTWRALKNWVKTFNAKLDVVNVVGDADTKPETVGSHALQYELGELNPRFHFIYENEIKQAIEKYVDENKPDLLVTMPGKYNLFSIWFHKSQSKKLIRQPHIPVLSIEQ